MTLLHALVVEEVRYAHRLGKQHDQGQLRAEEEGERRELAAERHRLVVGEEKDGPARNAAAKDDQNLHLWLRVVDHLLLAVRHDPDEHDKADCVDNPDLHIPQSHQRAQQVLVRGRHLEVGGGVLDAKPRPKLNLVVEQKSAVIPAVETSARTGDPAGVGVLVPVEEGQLYGGVEAVSVRVKAHLAAHACKVRVHHRVEQTRVLEQCAMLGADRKPHSHGGVVVFANYSQNM
jgi:hypothetical protein